MEIQFGAGCHISEAAKQLVAAAKQHGAAKGTFNEIELVASHDTSPDAVVADFDQKIEAAAEAYRNSPAGKRAAQEREEARQRAQAKHDELMAALPSLDMKDAKAVLNWCCQMQAPSDHVGVEVARGEIVYAFEAAGFRAGDNCGDSYRADDRDNSFRYLVGQALDGLKRGPAIHPIIHKFAAEWRARFG